VASRPEAPRFIPYSNPDSGVAAFRIDQDHIDVLFRRGGIYRYSVRSVGRENLIEMVRLAREGRGLATYINQVVHDRYERQLR
jgi:hypothetical protein